MKPYKMKQCISLMLVIAMALALVPTNVFSVEAQSGWTADTGSYALTQNEKAAEVSYRVTLHFANNLGWSQVNLFTWNDHCAPTGEWPGSGISRGSDGFYTATLEYDAPANQPLNFIFNNGNVQTVDLTLGADAFTQSAGGVYTAEKWVLLTTDSNGKYGAEIQENNSGFIVSPVVSGPSVTFRYYAPAAKAVYVAGSFNGWNTTANKMVKDSDGVWSLTLQNLAFGDYEYKFVADGAWYTDPGNTRMQNGNSAFIVLNPGAKDTNTVKVVVTYTRSDGNYKNWNIAAWDAPNLQGRYDFTVTGGVAQTTITLSGRTTKTVGFKIRKSVDGNDWAEESGEFRVNLGDIVSGTIYVNIANDFSSSQAMDTDVVCANKITDVQLNYDKNTITVTTSKAVDDPATAFLLYQNGKAADIIASVNAADSSYTLNLTEAPDLACLYQYTVCLAADTAFTHTGHSIGIDSVYASTKFAQEFTYDGTDLGANWTEEATKFVLWAPTAEAVQVNLYYSGDSGADDLYDTVPMVKSDKGTWVAVGDGDLNGLYYTYSVTVNGSTVEAIDPYARTTGINGDRGMVLNLNATEPADGWQEIAPLPSYTDAIIYELHIRDFSIDDDFGVSESNRGKYLAFTETESAAMQHLINLGITHIHLLPMYDYNSVDENRGGVFNWGYDPKNYNAPEGSYATDPYNGEVRVREMKEMVNALHRNGIGVIMDVVYNHVYDSYSFSFNKIVPGYFSRSNSNTSGCGNDTASEREMVRKYIVDSVLYWAQEYHLDGFRFDLVGLLDVETINQIVTEVHKLRPDILFYGEGWDMDSTNKESGTEMAKQGNAWQTPGFAYFSDSLRNALGGSNGNSLGFVAGAGNGSSIVNEWLANPWWSNNPQQVIQYASCHDNYTLADKLILSTNASGLNDTVIKMNNLAAAYYLTAQGVPFIHAGEEFLREKLEEDGSRCENSYNASDAVNRLEWSNLEKAEYADTVEYYKGLIAFRKAHPALRYSTGALIAENVRVLTANANLLVYLVDGNGAAGEDSDILVIFNAGSTAATVALPAGVWNVCVDGSDAGTETLYTVQSTAQVAGISAMVLTQKDTGKNETDTVTVYFSNNQSWSEVYAYYWGGNTSIQWPGVKMQWVKKNEYNEDVYCVTIPAGATGILFHNNAGTQTVDITPPKDGQGYYCTTQASGKWNYGTYIYNQ